MKRIYFTILSAAAVLAFAACEKDTTETPETPQPAVGETITVAASLAETTKTTFSDSEGIRWDAGDILRASAYRPAGEKNEWCWNRESTPAESAGTTGSFTFKEIQYDEKDESLWFMHGTEGGNVQNGLLFKYHDGSFVQAQSAAGTMNSAYLFLLSDPTTWNSITEVQDGGVGTVGENAVKLHIFGSVIRFIPYCSDAAFGTEKIVSIKLASDNSNVTGRSIYKPYTKTYDANNVLSQIAGKEITVKLAEAFALEGVDARDKSAGIYMAMPPIAKVEGYRYIVATDVATYTFDGSDKTLTLTDGVVKNIFLDLAKCTERSLPHMPLLQYEGAPGNQTLSGEAYTSNSIGYTVAKVSDDGGVTWTKHEAKGRDEFLYNPTFTITDAETGEAVDWVRCYLNEDQICHWSVQVDKNETGKVRKAKVHAVYGDIDGYKMVGTDLQPKTYEYEITVTQNPYSTNHVLTYGGGLVSSYNVPADGCTNQTLEWWAAYVDNVLSASFPAHLDFYKDVTFAVYDYSNDVQGAEVDWVSCQYARNAENVINDTHWRITAQSNNTGAERKAIIVGTFPDVKIGEHTYTVAEEYKTRTVVLTQPAL